MLTINRIYSILDNEAPFIISKEVVKNGGYDNSGIIINTHQEINSVMFSLDLSIECVEKAKKLKCDTIITHHPAIYNPLSSLDVNDVTSKALIRAIEYKLNVISLHLNLDFAEDGIDQNLAKALGATDAKILEKHYQNYGYGREFCLNKTTLFELLKKVKKELGSKRVIYYGSKNFAFNKVASFCGAGSSSALKAINTGECDAQVIVTSDAPHHVIKDIVESGRALIIPTHYSAENYGFKKFYEKIASLTKGQILTYYFEDKRYL